MVEISISELSKHPKILDELQEIAKVVNKKEGKVKGVFIPSPIGAEVEKLIEELERKRKKRFLAKIAKAQREDMVGDGAVGDGL